MEIINFDVYGDDRGSLISLEHFKNIPFNIKRVYYIFNTSSGVSRGFHAHINLRQVVIAIKGKCDFHIDEGRGMEVFTLNSPCRGVYIDKLTWREMHNFSDDCILMVLASENYDPSDYITNYEEFKGMANVKVR